MTNITVKGQHITDLAYIEAHLHRDKRTGRTTLIPSHIQYTPVGSLTPKRAPVSALTWHGTPRS